ncbi:hypothetical protein PG995_005613 [Apiospora arundinis]
MLHATSAQHLHPQDPAPEAKSYVHPDELRTGFALAMSQMYRNEVPLYGDLVRIVQGVNQNVLLSRNSSADTNKGTTDSPARLSLERHGAIRLGLPSELRTVRRIFAVLGMYPVGYYDLSVAGLPMHATCFRPTTSASLASNPFRIFTTLLRPELVKSEDGARDLTLQLLSRRTLFSPELLDMLDTAEQQQHNLYADQAETFIREALRTFSWASGVAASTADEYTRLRAEHPVLADIACFRTAHINHLTPRTLDIDAVQRAMVSEGMAVKERIEGPPRRRFPILLRQTSFLALDEPVHFLAKNVASAEVNESSSTSEHVDNRQEGLVEGTHCARFGEIEERGAAVTPAGRHLYDELLAQAMASINACSDGRKYNDILTETFRDRYPDNLSELCRQRLIFCRYRCAGKIPTTMHPDVAALISRGGTPSEIRNAIDEDEEAVIKCVDCLVDEGVLVAEPITYEDFLPFSAAGIFQSNLQKAGSSSSAGASIGEKKVSPHSGSAMDSSLGCRGGDQGSLEEALGCAITDPDVLYSQLQKESLSECLLELQLTKAA